MGLAASQARLLMLTSRKSDLELQGQFLNQSRMQLANTTGQLFQLTTDLEPGSPQAQQIQSRLGALQTLDKSLELQLKRIDTQHQAVMAEVEAVQSVLKKNIESTFKTFS